MLFVNYVNKHLVKHNAWVPAIIPVCVVVYHSDIIVLVDNAQCFFVVL